MTKTFEIIDSYLDNKEIKVYENGECVLDIILMENDYNIVRKILEALGYQLSYRAF